MFCAAFGFCYGTFNNSAVGIVMERATEAPPEFSFTECLHRSGFGLLARAGHAPLHTRLRLHPTVIYCTPNEIPLLILNDWL